MGKEDKWERERDREYIIVWKRERNLSREEKEEEEKKKKKKERTPETTEGTVKGSSGDTRQMEDFVGKEE